MTNSENSTNPPAKCGAGVNGRCGLWSQIVDLEDAVCRVRNFAEVLQRVGNTAGPDDKDAIMHLWTDIHDTAAELTERWHTLRVAAGGMPCTPSKEG